MSVTDDEKRAKARSHDLGLRMKGFVTTGKGTPERKGEKRA